MPRMSAIAAWQCRFTSPGMSTWRSSCTHLAGLEARQRFGGRNEGDDAPVLTATAWSREDAARLHRDHVGGEDQRVD